MPENHFRAPYYIEKEGVFYSRGRYETKLVKADLPADYLYGHFQPTVVGAVKTSGVRGLWYRPNLIEPAMFRWDLLYVSYKAPITGFPFPKHYDVELRGNIIPIFLLYVEQTSQYDIRRICRLIEEKRKWFLHAFPFDYEKEIGSAENIMDFYRSIYQQQKYNLQI